MSLPSTKPTKVALFVTCLVDLFRPTVGFAAVKLLEDAGLEVVVPDTQTCCGQPAYNSGDRRTTRSVALRVIDAFKDFSHVVVPSGSCAGMIRHHYPALLAGDAAAKTAAEDLAGRTWELVSFLTDVMGVTRTASDFTGSVTYHDACSGLRELHIKEQPRRLLAALPGITVSELAATEVCCGFGGTFCVKYPDISLEMVSKKAADVVATGAGTLLAGDLGCLLNIAGKLKRDEAPVAVRHIAEVLAGMTEGPAIGDAAGIGYAIGTVEER